MKMCTVQLLMCSRWKGTRNFLVGYASNPVQLIEKDAIKEQKIISNNTDRGRLVMGKRKQIDSGDTEDLNNLFRMGFVSLEEIVQHNIRDGEKVRALSEDEVAKKATKKAKTEWSVVKMPKAMPIPTDLPKTVWDQYGLDKTVLAGIYGMGYSSPTEIQSKILSNMSVKELVGSAPTGSGKTCAFALPILTHLASLSPNTVTHLQALILCPTRELALQVASHLKTLGRYIPHCRVVSIVGGMSEEKQERLLANSPTMVVGTPGRLAELAEFDEGLRSGLEKIKFLVIDEADRMVMDKQSRFPDLERLFKYTNSTGQSRHTYLFSATLSSEKLRNAFKGLKRRLGLNKPLQIHIDKAIDNLSEYKSLLLHPNDKDKWIYMTIKKNQSNSKTIVFVNSIEAVRRLHLVLSLVLPEVPVCPLHAQMQQRQRLRYLDRFKLSLNGVLVCSDVASRGLDIPLVQLVVQAEPPKTPDIHQHRVGRTARAGNAGSAIMLLSPKDAAGLKSDEKLRHLLQLKDWPGEKKATVGIDGMFEVVYEIEHLAYSSRKAGKEQRLLKVAEKELETAGGSVKVDEDELDLAVTNSKQMATLKNQLVQLHRSLKNE